MKFTALATDYDGTLARDGVVDEATISALRRAREGGIRLFLVTGREARHLPEVFPQFELFEQVVAENGAVIFDPATQREEVLGAPAPVELVRVLRERKVPLAVGRVVVATDAAHRKEMAEAIAELQLDWEVIGNKGAIMALPRGMNKASGLAALLKKLSLPAERVVGVGDAENDLDFLVVCGFSVAVANALPEVRRVVKWVTRESFGAGVGELIGRMLEGNLEAAARGG